MKPDRHKATESFEGNLAFTGDLTSTYPKQPNYRDAIRRKCIDCCCGQIAEIAKCEIKSCALWPFRFGSNPFFGHPGPNRRSG